MHTHTTIFGPSGFWPGLCRWASTRKVNQEGKTNLDSLEQETVSGSGVSWAICKPAPWPKHTTTPASHQSVFYRPNALPAAQPSASKHSRNKWTHAPLFNQSNLCCFRDILKQQTSKMAAVNEKATSAGHNGMTPSSSVVCKAQYIHLFNKNRWPQPKTSSILVRTGYSDLSLMTVINSHLML